MTLDFFAGFVLGVLASIGVLEIVGRAVVDAKREERKHIEAERSKEAKG